MSRPFPGWAGCCPRWTGLDPSYLVGGAVRDLLLGARSVDLDVAVEGDAPAVARTVAGRVGGEAVVHDRFGTATVRAGDSRRRPGVHPAGDLRAPGRAAHGRAGRTGRGPAPAGLHGECDGDRPHRGGRGRAARPARRGGRRGEPARSACCTTRSFIDDPTRLLRAVRYEARLGFAHGLHDRAARPRGGGGRRAGTVSGAARARRADGPARRRARRRPRSSEWRGLGIARGAGSRPARRR